MTKKARLLIVDDGLDKPAGAFGGPRREYYEKLTEYFDLLYLEKPADLSGLIDRREVDAALVDFVLDGWGINVLAILKIIDDRVPTALISNHWTPNFEELRLAMDGHSISRLFVWEEITKPHGRDLVGLWLNLTIRKNQRYDLAEFGDEQSYKIVQLSDLQFGSAGPEAFNTDTQLALQTIGSTWGSPPQLIALTGDVAEGGRPAEYKEAEAWIDGFGKKLGSLWTRRNLRLIPGNHDVSWSLALASRVDAPKKKIDLEKVRSPDLQAFAFAPFRQFAKLFGDAEDWGDDRNYWVSGRHRHWGIILFGYNTCEVLDEWGETTRRLDDKNVASLFDDLRTLKRDAPDALIVGLMHHPLMGDEECIANAPVFRRNLTKELGTIVLLTGHVHAAGCSVITGDGSGFLQIIGSTFSKLALKRPEDSQRGFNLIELKRSRGFVREIYVTPVNFTHRGIDRSVPQIFLRQDDGRIQEKS
jgi:predicted MPP superfamily phosphohydrolase